MTKEIESHAEKQLNKFIERKMKKEVISLDKKKCKHNWKSIDKIEYTPFGAFITLYCSKCAIAKSVKVK